MTFTSVPGADATHDNIGHLPSGVQVAGYDTGSGGIAWTAEDYAGHPGAVHIDQDPGATDHTADVLDVENGAATPADCPGWADKALADYRAASRHGQRSPAIYTSQANVTTVVNALVNGGVHGGVGLWVANWNLTQAQAAALVENASGPFPIVAVQYSDQGGGGTYDEDEFSKEWLEAVSPLPAPGPFRHVVTGTTGDSLGKIADDRHVTVGHILSVSSGFLTTGHLQVLQAYITLEALMIANGMTRPAAPNDLIYYTDNA